MEYNFKVDGDKLYCRICGGKVGWKFVGDQWLLSSNSEGDEEKGICHTCLVEHCCNTNCLGCDWYKYPNCPHIETKKIYMEVNMDNTYGCDICGERKDYDEEIIWITSTYGVCEECFNKLTNEDLDNIRHDYE